VRKSLWATLAVALLLGAGTVSSAQEPASTGGKKPVITLSFAGFEQAVGNAKTIVNVAGRPELAMLIDMAGTQVKGLDKARPWAAMVYDVSDDKPSFNAFVPVTDLKEVLASIPNPEIKGLKPDGDGVYEIKAPNRTAYLQQKGQWAVIAESRDALKNAPADPTAALGDLTKKYVLAAKVSVANLPENLRKKFVDEMQSGAAPALAKKPDEDDDQYAIRVNVAKKTIKKITDLVNELDEIVLGWAVDATTNATYLDLDVTAKAGTPTAQQLAGVKDGKTNFAGFLIPGAAITAIGTGALSDEDVTQVKATLDQLRKSTAKEIEANADLTKEQQQLATRLIGDVLDVLVKTAEGKKSDGGMALVLEPGAPTFVLGTTVADGKKLEKVVKDLVAEAGKEQPDVANLIKLNADSQGGVNFHVATIPVPDEVSGFVGDKVEIVIGIGDDSVYVGAGKNAVKTLKQVIEKSKAEAGKTVPALQLTIAATPIAKFVAAIPLLPIPPEVGKAAELLGQMPGKDHIILTSRTIPNGMGLRLNVEEGLLKTIGKLAPPIGPGGAAPGGAVPSAPPSEKKTEVKPEP
jgi:hypothetical protein